MGMDAFAAFCAAVQGAQSGIGTKNNNFFQHVKTTLSSGGIESLRLSM